MAWYNPELLDSLFQRFELVSSPSSQDFDEDGFGRDFDGDDDNFSLASKSRQGDGDEAKPALVKTSSASKLFAHAKSFPIKKLSSTPSQDEAGGRKHLKSFSSSVEAMLPKKNVARLSREGSGSKRPSSAAPATAATQHKFACGDSIHPEKQTVRCLDSPANLIQVRVGPNYKKNGHKQYSQMDSLYEYFQVDILKSKRKLCEVHSQIQFPSAAAAPSIKLPSFLMINFQLPNKPPTLFRSANALDDPGTSFILYFKLRSGLTASQPGVKLAETFFAQNQLERLKILIYVDNLDEVKIPSLLQRPIAKFLGKPVMLGTPLIVTSEVCEIDIDVFQFPVLARTILANCRGILPTGQLRMALVIQGETDNELPERVLACCSIAELNLDSNVYERFA
ncbi:hypothetical protein BASA81_015391 [Batrachochytrium salamandrivorans]|nr:hypothetical protein BASA81_015391 [Batrachochytrium salamandrivorans]